MRRFGVAAVVAGARARGAVGALFVSGLEEGARAGRERGSSSSRSTAPSSTAICERRRSFRRARTAAIAPSLVFLHGRGGDDDSNLDGEMFLAPSSARLQGAGDRVPERGGNSYWHDRLDGAGAPVDNEVILQAQARFGTDTGRVAVGGISMGGFAYNLALLEPSPSVPWRAPRRRCGRGPCRRRRERSTTPATERHDLIGEAHCIRAASRASRYGSTPAGATRSTAATVPPSMRSATARSGSAPPARRYDRSVLAAHWASYLRFYATALARCG